MLKSENEKLKEEALKLTKFEKITHCLNEMLSNQNPFGDKLGLGFNSFEASSSGTKEIKIVKAQKKTSSDGGPINMGCPQRKTPYELLKGRKPTLDYFRVFESKCFILNTKDYLAKFNPNSYEGVFLGYSQNSKAYIILNKHTRKVKESLNVIFDETPSPSTTSPLVNDDLDEEEAIKVTEKKNLENDIEDETLEIDKIVNIKESRNHPLENVIGNLNQRTLRSQAQNQSNFFCFISTIKPKNVNEALTDDSWIVAMQEELNQFIANDIWQLVPQPRNMTIIGTKWLFRNKLDENGIVSRNKARLPKPLPLKRLSISSDTLKMRSDHGKKRPRESNASSSSTTLNHTSSSRPLDDTIDVMMKNHFIPTLPLLLKTSLPRPMLSLEFIKTLLMKVMT
nr:retrovirus-related Pol polyprotein from transposon TNT 1-94 [Tanacetum cinerariifolium]